LTKNLLGHIMQFSN